MHHIQDLSKGFFIFTPSSKYFLLPCHKHHFFVTRRKLSPSTVCLSATYFVLFLYIIFPQGRSHSVAKVSLEVSVAQVSLLDVYISSCSPFIEHTKLKLLTRVTSYEKNLVSMFLM